MAFIPVYILILGFTIVVDYFAGIWLEETEGNKRKYFLIVSLIANIGVLAVFKYYNFLNDNLSSFLNSIGYINKIPHLGLILPIGLSFHTFQAMSYTIEVYRGHQKAERNFITYSLYVMFYPQLVAGPIERPQNLIHQFYEKHEFEYERIVEGLKMMLWGFFMKLVIADRLAIYVNAVYNNSAQHSGVSLLVATIFFAFQIYCDFAGYSNIAIGAARILGINLMTNFNRPYLSNSVSEFWKRWHISLSSWFRDYFYISLGGNRVSIPRWYLNLIIVFLVSGLWHGPNWTFILWGGLNGLYLVIAIITKDLRKDINHVLLLDRTPRLHKFLEIIITFILISASWVFFRASSVHEAFNILSKICLLKGPLFIGTPAFLIYSLSGIILLILIEIKLEYFHNRLSFFHNPNPWVRKLSYSFLVMLILMFGVLDGGQFIYFQF
jgi:alginate O-acetyltransferase complex protein AlgI